MSNEQIATPQGVLGHGLTGPPLLDPEDVRAGVDIGDGTLGTLTPMPEPASELDDLTGIPAVEREMLDALYDNTWETGWARAVTISSRTPTVGAIALVVAITAQELKENPGVNTDGDLRVSIRRSAELASLTTADDITIGTVKYRIVSLSEAYLGGVLYEWKCQARR